MTTWLVGPLFLMTAPVIENYYTLSKGEPVQALLITLSLVAVTKASRMAPGASRIGFAAGAAVALLLANWTKESGVLALAIGGTWAALSRIGRPRNDRADPTSSAAGLFLRVAAIATLAFLTTQLRFLAGAGGSGYASGFEFSFERLISSSVRWGVWLLYSFPHLLPLAALGAMLLGKGQRTRISPLVVGSLVWMGWWWVAYLPWVFVASYYLLPFSLGAAMFGASVIEASAALASRQGVGGWARRALLAAAALLFVMAQFNHAAMGRAQLVVDSVNARGLEALGRLAPRGSTIALGIARPSEYLEQARRLLREVHGRDDIEVMYFEPPEGLVEGRSLPATAALVTLRSQVLLSPRLGVDEPDQRELASGLERVLGLHYDETFHIEQDAYGLRFDFPKVMCPLFRRPLGASGFGLSLPGSSIARYCADPLWIDRRSFVYRWVGYTVTPAEP